MNVRRVVTGHDASGKSVFVSDEQVAPVEPMLMPTAEFHRLWGGTRHRWSNPGTTMARLAVFMVGANHADVPPLS